MDSVNFDSFSVAQMQSKLCLVQTLERSLQEHRPIEDGYRIWILAGWYALANLLIRTRNQIPVLEVRSFDQDPKCEKIADSINRLWVYKAWEFKAHTLDINRLEYSPKPDVVINSSVEHMSSNEWFENIPKGTIVCLQASDMSDHDHCNKFSNSRDLMLAYPLDEVIYDGIKRFEFEDKCFYRSMIIGVK
jgi:hypothetical protein